MKNAQVNLGEIGYSGQSGWFLSAPALHAHMPLAFSSINPDTGATQETQLLDKEAFTSLTLANFSSWRNVLARAKDIPDYPSHACDGGSVANPDTVAGTYTCNLTSGVSEWYPTNRVCCPRNSSLLPECASGAANRPPDCIAVLADGPDIGRDEVRNRGLVEASGLPLEMTYAPYQEAIDALQQLNKPVLFYRWEGDYFIVTNPNRFLRLDLTLATRMLPIYSRGPAYAPCPHARDATRASPATRLLCLHADTSAR